MNMGDIQNVLHNLDGKSEYSKVLQVVKVPAIYEIHLEKLQKKNVHHEQKENSKNTQQPDEWLQKKKVKTEDIIYGNTRNMKSGFKDYANIDDWLKDTTGNYNIEENDRKKSTSQEIEKPKYHNGQPKLTWSPFIGSEIPSSNYYNSMNLKQSNTISYQPETFGTNQKSTPYSPEYTTRKKKTSSYNPTEQEPLFESTRNIYSVAPLNQPQAMFEVAPPALGKNTIYKNQQPLRPIVNSYSTLSPVLPYDLKGNKGTIFFRNTQRSEGSVEDPSNTNQNVKNPAGQIPDAVNAAVKPNMAAVFFNQETDRNFSHENCKQQQPFNSYDKQVYASSRTDNIYLTTDRPEKKTFRSLSRGPKYVFPDIFRTRGNRRSGEPLRYVLYIKEKYSDEDDRK